jgi:hypothetical protein
MRLGVKPSIEEPGDGGIAGHAWSVTDLALRRL